MKNWRADVTFFIGEFDTFAPEGDLSKIRRGEIIGEFEDANITLVKEQQLPQGLPDTALEFLTLDSTVPDPPQNCTC